MNAVKSSRLYGGLSDIGILLLLCIPWLAGCGAQDAAVDDSYDKKIDLPVFGIPWQADSAPRYVVANTQRGKLMGVQAGNVTKFLGIPFAQSTAGALRWADPQPPLPWQGVFDATKFGHACTQYVPWLPSARNTPDENCLNLNVWIPNTPGPHPVMVWVYGGAGILGSGNEFEYDGARLAVAQNVIVVTVNYRLWLSGFLALPALGSRPEIKGNQGIKDLIAALQWVHTDISGLSGDPDNVTVFGESAGAINICALLATPLTKSPIRLLHKAILQSGSCDSIAMQSLPQAQAAGLQLIEKLGCSQATEPLDCARNISAEQLRKIASPTLQMVAQNFSVWPYGLTIDGVVFPEHPFLLLAKPQAQATPILLGTNKDEGSLFAAMTLSHPAPEGYARFLEQNFPGQQTALLERYPMTDYVNTGAAHAAILGDLIMNCPALHLARSYSAAGNPTWLYHFIYKVNSPVTGLTPLLLGPTSAPFGTFHATDIGFVLGTPMLTTLNSTSDKAVMQQFQQYWGNFARSGNPNGNTVGNWQLFDGQRNNYLAIDVESKNDDGFRKSYCDYWIPRAEATAAALK